MAETRNSLRSLAKKPGGSCRLIPHLDQMVESSLPVKHDARQALSSGTW